MTDAVNSQALPQMGKARRGRPKAADRDLAPTLILQAALVLFRKQGLAATSLEQIAAAAGSAKTTIYRHFGSKEALAEAAVAFDGQNVLQVIKARESVDTDPVIRLRELALAIADFSALPSSAQLYRFSISSVPGVPAVGNAFAETGTALRAMMIPHIIEAQRASLLRSDDPDTLARHLYDVVVTPIWNDSLLMLDYVTDPDKRALVLRRNWDFFLRGARP